MQQDDLPQGVAKVGLQADGTGIHGAFRLGGTVRLTRGRVHEVMGNSADVFAMIVASGLSGSVFWIGQPAGIDSLAPTGFQQFVDPARLTLVKGRSRLEVLWAMEVALGTGGIACAVAELRTGPDLRESRRLQIASGQGGVLGLVLIEGRAQTSASETRWRCEAVGDANMAWLWSCIKNRRGGTGSWRATWRATENGSGTVHLASAAAA